MGDGVSPRFGECTDNKTQNTSYQICKAQVLVFGKDTRVSLVGTFWVPVAAVPGPLSIIIIITIMPGSSPKSPLLPPCHGTHGSSLCPFREQVTFNSTESFPFPLPEGGPCIKTERGRPHPARRPGWPGNPGTPRCCRWRGRSLVHSRPGPSWAGAPLVRSVPWWPSRCLGTPSWRSRAGGPAVPAGTPGTGGCRRGWWSAGRGTAPGPGSRRAPGQSSRWCPPAAPAPARLRSGCCKSHWNGSFPTWRAHLQGKRTGLMEELQSLRNSCKLWYK